MKSDHDLKLMRLALAQWRRLYPGRAIETMTREEYLEAHKIVAQEEAETGGRRDA
jgi:hypothetical protein